MSFKHVFFIILTFYSGIISPINFKYIICFADDRVFSWWNLYFISCSISALFWVDATLFIILAIKSNDFSLTRCAPYTSYSNAPSNNSTDILFSKKS